MLNTVDFPAAQRQYYDQLFKIADADGDGFIGLNDSAFFRKSNLPNTVLGEVWQLADIRKEGRLDKEGFVIALSLVSLAQQGKRLGLDALRTVVPPPRLQDIPPMKEIDWIVTPQEKKQYVEIFRASDDDGDGFITGAQARSLFSSSGLPLPLLSQIWTMADLNKDQKLDQHEFIVAMYLISVKRRGFEVPATVPESLIASAWPDPSSPTQTSLPPGQAALSVPKGNEWVIPPAEKVKYDDVFKKTDSDFDGFISGEQARQLFLRSGVPMPELSRIWLLSDINQDQRLDRQEFAIAMYLIRCRLQGRDIPTPLPEALIASARDDFVPPQGTAAVPKDTKSRYEINLDEMVGPASSPAISTPNATSPTPPSGIPSISINPEATPPHVAGVPPLERKFSSTTSLHSGSGSIPPGHSGQFLAGTSSVGALSPAVGMSPAVSSAPAVLQPPQFGVLSPQFGSVQLVPNPALEVERTRQSIAHHERTKAEMTQQLQETTTTANESARMLEEERARADTLVAEIGELESQIGAQRARGASYKDNITAIRLEVKNMTTQKEQLEELLKEKRLQCEDQEQILGDLRIELNEKTNEAERYQREIEQLKIRLESLRIATTDVKTQLAAAKKHITENKSEVARINEETKGLRSAASSPPLTTRAASPMGSYPNTPTLPSLHPPVQRTSSMSSAFHDSSPTSAVSSPALSHPTNLASSPTTTPFAFPPSNSTDTFSFDNGHEDPFAFPSKDGFGLAAVTTDSFGSSAVATGQTSPSPPHPTQETPVFGDPSSFFSNDNFGETKDPFASVSSTGGDQTPDPFAASYASFGSVAAKDAFESFTASGSDSFSSAGAGSVAKSVVVPPTPYNTVIGERKGGLSGADIANAFSAAAFGGVNGNETTNSFFGSNEETFGASAFASTTSDSFGSTNDAFSSAGSVSSLRESGGFHEGMFKQGSGAFHAVDADSFGQRGSGSYPSVVDDSKQRGSGAFQPVEKTNSDDGHSHSSQLSHSQPFGNDTFGGANDAFGTADAFGTTTNAFGSSEGFGNTNDAFGSAGADAFGSSSGNDAFSSADEIFGKTDVFGKADAFGGSSNSAFGFSNDGSGLTNSGGSGSGGAEGSEKFGEDAFGKSSEGAFTGTFNFADKKDDFF